MAKKKKAKKAKARRAAPKRPPKKRNPKAKPIHRGPFHLVYAPANNQWWITYGSGPVSSWSVLSRHASYAVAKAEWDRIHPQLREVAEGERGRHRRRNARAAGKKKVTAGRAKKAARASRARARLALAVAKARGIAEGLRRAGVRARVVVKRCGVRVH